MELADSKLIDALRQTVPAARSGQPRMKKAISFEPTYQSPRSPAKRCRCGDCPYCRENARWERIFQEKFADPDYYATRVPPQGSSLSWL